MKNTVLTLSTFLAISAFITPTLAAPSQNSQPSLISLDGTDVVTDKTIHVDLKNSAKKGTVLIFLSGKCPCSASHEILLKNLAQQFTEFTFLGIHSNADEPAPLTKKHFEEAHLNFSVLQDRKNIWANQLGALKTPHAFVFDSQGDLLYQGGVTDSHVGPSAKKQFLKEVLEDLQAGKTPRHKEGRALGCFIQREE